MRAYNIYYKNEKINKSPISKEELSLLYGNDIIKKQTKNGNINIPVKNCKIIEITIV